MRMLSVVIVGRNEERHIKKCIQSVMAGCSRIPDTEILYVDSASSDDTIEIAKSFPIRIIQLKPEWFLTSSAGRYSGYINTSGKYILFVDGDTIVYKQWPQQAIAFLENNTEAAGVAGILHEIFTDDDGKITEIKKNRYNQQNATLPVRVFGGTACYRRSALEESGPFNPYVRATPELELALRIRQQGYSLMRLYTQMAITYAPKRETIKEIFRRAESNLYAMGNTLKYCQSRGLFWPYIRERMGFILIFAAAVFFFVAGLITAAVLNSVIIACIVTGFIFVYISFYMVQRKSITQVLISLIKRSVILYKTIESYFKYPLHDMSAYPKDVIKIK